MGKGDRKSRRGKLYAGTYGKRRPRKKKKEKEKKARSKS
jgi:30S ribosomal protein S31